MGMVGEACLPSNAYYPRTPDYTLYSGVHVCWSEHSDSSFVYGFMSLDYGLGTMTATTFKILSGNEILTINKGHNSVVNLRKLRRNNPNVKLVKVNAYAKFDQIPSIHSEDTRINRKRTFVNNQGSNLDNSQGP